MWLAHEQVIRAANAILATYTNPFTRKKYLQGLRTLLRDLHDHHGAPDYTRRLPKIRRPNPRNVTATSAERAALLAAAKPALRLWLLFCSDLALRSGTAARIAPEHYDSETGCISFRTKFDVAQTLPVTKEIADILAGLPGKRGVPYIAQFPHHQNKAPSAHSLRFDFAALRSRLGMRRITAHDLRRTTAVRTLETTKDIRVVQALLGHGDLPTTLWYLDHNITPVRREVLELAKLNERKKP